MAPARCLQLALATVFLGQVAAHKGASHPKLPRELIEDLEGRARSAQPRQAPALLKSEMKQDSHQSPVPAWSWTHGSRQLQSLKQCADAASCGPSEYCMSCDKCGEYHASLSRSDQKRWTCDPCEDGATHCESGKYCEVARDSVDGTCRKDYAGCGQHSDCKDGEYCFSCQKCEEYIKIHGDNVSLWQCQPCPTTQGGFCSLHGWCSIRQDSITGSCPVDGGCTSHQDCKEGQYCESCELCEAFRASLPEDRRHQWSCAPCPTAGGGICEDARLCQVANDGIDRTCPPAKGCDSHAQCRPDEYCMDCAECAAYRDSLEPSQRRSWPCGYCPTARGGNCERRVFCSVADDSIGDDCPAYAGCDRHDDCEATEFCWSWHACKEEEARGNGKCGDKPQKDGFCNPGAACHAARSIDGLCKGSRACNNHAECGLNSSSFCTPWQECEARNPGACGPQYAHKEGVCVPTEHCVRGFHTPISGDCPAWNRDPATLEITEVLKLNGSLMLATFHQAINAWSGLASPGDSDFVLAQLHDYANGSTRKDDSEYVGVYEAKSGKLTEAKMVRTSCPWVEIAIPAKSPKFFEARIFMSELEMSNTHSECSCILGESLGRCPRGASYATAPVDGQSCKNLGAVSQATPKLELLATGRAEELRSCAGAVEVSAGASFELRSEGATVRFLRLDTFLIQEATVEAGMYLTSDGQHLRCESEDEMRGPCGSLLPRRIDLPVVIDSISFGANPGENRIDGLSKARYCARCLAAMKRFHSVLFVDATSGRALQNNLTLYSMRQDVVGAAVLVDSSLANGEGTADKGCPWLEATASTGPSLQKIRDDSKVLPNSHVSGKWCVVVMGECSFSAKVKFCVAGGAAGVMIMEEARPEGHRSLPIADTQGQVFVKMDEGESLSDMVPVLFTSFDEAFFQLLSQGKEPTLAAGPGIGVRTVLGSGIEISTGGARVYDAVTGQWTNGGGGFGSQRWMEHSSVRDVLFVCTANQQILALDTSRPDHRLVQLGSAPRGVACTASSTFRDIHIVDFRQGDKFFTVFVDADAARNHLIFFDTTSLSDWRKLSEVHANWEHETQGLGQVKATQDGEMLLVTWHCSTLYCGRGTSSDGSRPGEKLYVLSLTQGLDKGYAPPVLGAVQLPMSPGSIVRDVACTAQNLCLVSMSWDGIAVVDLGDTPNRLKVIAQHSSSFTGWTTSQSEHTDLPAEVAYIRMVAGAQKIVPSRTRDDRFFLERWSFDALSWYHDGKSLTDSLRYDSIWAIDVVGYVRPDAASGIPPIFDPAVSASLLMPAVLWSSVASMSGGQDGFEKVFARGLQAALGLQSDRLLVRNSAPSRGGQGGTVVEFTILDGNGASPETLFNALWRQLDTELSAIHTGPLKAYVDGAKLQRQGAPPPSAGGRDSDRKDRAGTQTGRDNLRSRPGEDPGPDFFGAAVFVLAMVAAVAAFYYFVCMRRAMQKVEEENRRLREEHMHLAAAAYVPTGAAAGQVGLATGYVIGRPGLGNDGETPSSEKRPPSAESAGGVAYAVVGNPINAGGAAAAGIAAGVAMHGGTPSSKLDQPERPTPSWPAEASAEASAPRSEAEEPEPVVSPSVVRAPTGNTAGSSTNATDAA